MAVITLQVSSMKLAVYVWCQFRNRHFDSLNSTGLKTVRTVKGKLACERSGSGRVFSGSEI